MAFAVMISLYGLNFFEESFLILSTCVLFWFNTTVEGGLLFLDEVLNTEHEMNKATVEPSINIFFMITMFVFYWESDFIVWLLL